MFSKPTGRLSHFGKKQPLCVLYWRSYIFRENSLCVFLGAQNLTQGMGSDLKTMEFLLHIARGLYGSSLGRYPCHGFIVINYFEPGKSGYLSLAK